MTLCHAAEEALLHVITMIFRRVRELLTPAAEAAATAEAAQQRAALEELRREGRGFGLPCAVKVMGFLCAQLQRGPSLSAHARALASLDPGSSSSSSPQASAEKDATRRLCLGLLGAALHECGGDAVAACPPLLSLLRDDACHALLWIGQGGQRDVSLETLATAMGLVRLLWGPSFRRSLKIQFEALLLGVFLRHLKHLAEVAQKHEDGAADSLSGALEVCAENILYWIILF